MAEQDDLALTVKGAARLAGYGRAAIPAAREPDLELPVLATVSNGARAGRAWVERASGAEGLAANEVVLSRRSARSIGLGSVEGAQVRLALPAHRRVKLVAAHADDLSDGATVHVGRDLYGTLGLSVRHPWALLTARGVPAPVRVLRRDDMPDGRARASMLVRTLTSTRAGEPVQLSALPRRTRDERRAALRQRAPGPRGRGRRSAWLLLQEGRAVHVLRLADRLGEMLLRALLRAPRFTVITTQTLPGDDVGAVARLHPSLFTALGLAQGDQVLVRWSDEETSVTALADYTAPAADGYEAVRRAWTVGRESPLPDGGFPPHLVVRLSARTRYELAIPSATVVEIRRRLRPLVLKNLNQLSIPLTGVAISAATVDSLRGWPIAAGVGIAVVLGLANLRVAKPPRGLWP